MTEGRFLWNNDRVNLLIALYREMPELWDVDHPQYRDRKVKQTLLGRLARHLTSPEHEINRKIHNLRNQMSQEVRKLKDGEYTGKWPHFESLTFILPALCSRSIATSPLSQNRAREWSQLQMNFDIHPTIPSEQDCAEYLLPETEEEVTPPLKRSRSPHEDDNRNNGNYHDEWNVFGQFVASELRQLKTEKARKSLKRTIQQVILDITDLDDAEVKRRCSCQLPDSSNNVYK